MLEASAMDKKNLTRLTSSAPKGIGSSEPKNKQDGSTKQQQPMPQVGRGGRRRDGGRTQQPEPSRRSAVPHGRYDKRPQPRGAGGGPNAQATRGEVTRCLEEAPFEEVLRKGSKKVNLNHLLKFTLAPREAGELHHRIQQHRPAKHSKEQFLQANCQFVVRGWASDEKQRRRWGDPDAPVEWGMVEEVRVWGLAQCPVCLDVPRAAHMPPCGHVHCWPCLLHYLALSDKPWRPCPICFQPFCAAELRSVLPQSKVTYQPGDLISMCLMRRSRDGCLPVPAALWSEDLRGPLDVDQESAMTLYQKVLVASVGQVGLILDREERELRQQLQEEGDAPEACFVQEALQALKGRREALMADAAAHDANANADAGILDSEGNLVIGHDTTDCKPVLEEYPTGRNMNDILGDTIPDIGAAGRTPLAPRERYVSSSSSGDGESTVTADDLELPAPGERGGQPRRDGAKDCFYYFQAADGQAIFLHALNVRMLVRDYGSLEHSPATIAARIVEIEGVSIDAEMRRRLRYLRHLPLTCEIQVVELQLGPPLITSETAKHFAPDVEKRRRLRSKRARSEKRRDRLLAQEELRRRGQGQAARYNLDSVKHFPTYDSPDLQEEQLPSQATSASSRSSPYSVSDLEEGHGAGSSRDQRSEDKAPRVSFAQMVQTKGTSCASSSSSVATRGAPPSRGSDSSSVPVQLDSDGEEFAPAPQFQHSFSMALEEALNSLPTAAAGVAQGGPKGKSGCKKKKKNMTLLFATSMNRSK